MPPPANPAHRPQSDSDLRFTRQKPVHWLDPRQLFDTAWRAVVSVMFGSYSDRREMEAGFAETTVHDRTAGDEMWIDYVADTGDGFEATYTIAHLLGQPTLSIPGSGGERATARGGILVMGGDQVYPTASESRYENRLVGPYRAALPHSDRPSPELFAIPGNHDWFDGLTSFLRVFCQRKWVGGWKTEQTRSYFAIRLPHRWWLWGIDIQLTSYVDQPQLEFFRDTVARKVCPGDAIILCTAVPAWLDAGNDKNNACRNLAFFEREVIRPTNAHVMLYLSGDLHHYARYEEKGATPPRQRITAGGGGAFLYPTHHLAPDLRLEENRGEWVPYERRAEYPPEDVSRRYTSRRIWRLMVLNPGFAALCGFVYLTIGWFTAVGRSETGALVRNLVRTITFLQLWRGLVLSPASLTLLLILLTGLVAFAEPPRPRRGARLLMGFLHTAAHVVAAAAIAMVASWLIHWRWVPPLFSPVLYILLLGALGALAGSLVMALYLFVSDKLGTHETEAFGALRITECKNFLRMHLARDGSLTVYPVGVDRPATTFEIVSDGERVDPWLRPEPPSAPHLIEDPIVIPGPATPAPAPVPGLGDQRVPATQPAAPAAVRGAQP